MNFRMGTGEQLILGTCGGSLALLSLAALARDLSGVVEISCFFLSRVVLLRLVGGLGTTGELDVAFLTAGGSELLVISFNRM
jgi:hypothetical protein